ncbi:MAG: DUF962 domain-containing protein [Myxococcales bacterium]|nr:DUF962 domain-containing protein [Myxococcales bacterium]
MRKTLREYLDQYAAEHQHLGTRITHFIGIPMIVASLPLLPLNPPVGGALFVGGWILQFIGHAVFEKSKPSFFSDPFYMLVGPIWVAIEMAQLLGITIPIPEAEPVPSDAN